MKKPHLIAAAIAGLIVIWLASSWVIPSSDDEDGLDSTQSAIDLEAAIKIDHMRSELHQRYVTLYGATEANRKVHLKAETQGAVIAIPATEGQTLKKGDVIVEIDERDRRARYAQAKALLEQRRIEHQAAKKLQEEGFQTEIRLAEAKTRLEEAKVNLRQIDLDLQFTKLRAPFDCVLETINVEVGDFVGVGVFGGEGALATVVDHDPLLIIGQVAERDRNHIEVGATAKGELSDGTKLEGTITYLASVADTESRTFRIEVQIPNAAREIPAGVTAELAIPAEQQHAYFVSPSVLSLDDDGQVGVKVVDEHNVVRFMKVEILEDGQSGMWIAGLPEQVNMITLGHAFVGANQQLDADMVARLLSPKEKSAVPKTDEIG